MAFRQKLVTSVRCYARGAVPNSCDPVPHLQSISLLTYMPLADSPSEIGRGGWLGHLQNLCVHVLMPFYTHVRVTKTKTEPRSVGFLALAFARQTLLAVAKKKPIRTASPWRRYGDQKYPGCSDWFVACRQPTGKEVYSGGTARAMSTTSWAIPPCEWYVSTPNIVRRASSCFMLPAWNSIPVEKDNWNHLEISTGPHIGLYHRCLPELPAPFHDVCRESVL